jgi:RNA polymerase sigma-70 factor (ECF subfamily)
MRKVDKSKMKEITLMPQTSFLIAAAKDGDPVALNQLVKLWYKRIYNFAFKYFGDHDMAMEVIQKTFISMDKNLKSLKDESSFKSWIYRIASNYSTRKLENKKENGSFLL